MRKFVIERTIPGLGQMTPEQLKEIANSSCDVAGKLGKPYYWVHSYCTDDKMFCVHVAESEEVVREHARRGGFPIDSVREVTGIIDPATAG